MKKFDTEEKDLIFKKDVTIEDRREMAKDFFAGFSGNFNLSDVDTLFIWNFCIIKIEDVRSIKVTRFKIDGTFYFSLMTKNADIFTSRYYDSKEIVKW